MEKLSYLSNGIIFIKSGIRFANTQYDPNLLKHIPMYFKMWDKKGMREKYWLYSYSIS